MLTEAQKRAKNKYREKNKDKANYIAAKSSAKSFIRTKATIEDLKELEKIINERIKELWNLEWENQV